MAGRQPVAAAAAEAIDARVNHVPAAAVAAAGAADVGPAVQWAAPKELYRVSQCWSV